MTLLNDQMVVYTKSQVYQTRVQNSFKSHTGIVLSWLTQIKHVLSRIIQALLDNPSLLVCLAVFQIHSPAGHLVWLVIAFSGQ